MNLSTFKIREITQSDLEAVSEVIKKAMEPEVQSRKLSQEALDECYAHNIPNSLLKRVSGNYFYIAENLANGQIVGVIGLRKNDANGMYNRVSTYNVHPEFQGRGIGTLLYKQIKITAKKLGCKNLVVSSSLSAEPIYKHFGFKRIKKIWHGFKDGSGYYNIWMEQNL